MEYLLKDLIIRILILLPVKSLLRCKCVCKSWFSLISDSQFAKSHFDLAAAPTHRLLLHSSMTFQPSLTRSIDLDAPSLRCNYAFATLNPSFLPPQTLSRIKGSCRGFVLFQNTSQFCDRKDLYLWNPSTGSHKHIPLSPAALSEGPVNYLQHLYGFGFDPSTDDYLVLRPQWGRFKINYFEMFSVRNNSWNIIKATNSHYYPLSYEDAQSGILFNGALHWLVHRWDVFLNVILAFDLKERTFSDIPVPDFLSEHMLMHIIRHAHLRVLGGLLSLCVPKDGSIDIYVMEQYKEQSSWTAFTVVDYNNPINADVFENGFSPICSTKSGDIVGIGESRVVKCNANGELLEHRDCDCPIRFATEGAMYQESLLSLPVVNAQVQEDEQNE